MTAKKPKPAPEKAPKTPTGEEESVTFTDKGSGKSVTLTGGALDHFVHKSVDEGVFDAAREMVAGILENNIRGIQEAYSKTIDDPETRDNGMSVSLSLKIVPGDVPKSHQITVSINFVEKRTKETDSTVVEEDQLRFAFPKTGEAGKKGK